jgi:hypothetical protein
MLVSIRSTSFLFVASDKLAMQYRRWRNTVAAETTPNLQHRDITMHIFMTAEELIAEKN